MLRLNKTCVTHKALLIHIKLIFFGGGKATGSKKKTNERKREVKRLGATKTLVPDASEKISGVPLCLRCKLRQVPSSSGTLIRLGSSRSFRTEEGSTKVLLLAGIFRPIVLPVTEEPKQFVLLRSTKSLCHLPPISLIVLDWPKPKAGCFRIRVLAVVLVCALLLHCRCACRSCAALEHTVQRNPRG